MVDGQVGGYLAVLVHNGNDLARVPGDADVLGEEREEVVASAGEEVG